MPRAPAARPRRHRSGDIASVPLAGATRILLEQCAAAAGTTADEHATALILRDAQGRGLLHGTAAPRGSVIGPLTSEWELELAAYPPAGQC